jgi:hypothetical protein
MITDSRRGQGGPCRGSGAGGVMGPWGSGTGQPRGKGLVFEKMSIARSCLGEAIQTATGMLGTA